MNFTQFNDQQKYLNAQDTIKPKDYAETVLAFFTYGEHIGHYQAYTRANPGQLNGLVLAIWNGKPAGTTGANLITYLAGQTDTLWRNTVMARGEVQRQLERTQRLAYWTNGVGVDSCPTLEEYAKNSIPATALDSLKISKIHLQDYVALLQALSNAYVAETTINKYNQNHKQAVKLTEEAASFAGATDTELLNTDGSYKKDSEKWKRMIACANYWIGELPATAGRRTARTNIDNWVGAGTADKLMRRVSSGERDHVIGNQVISQGPSSYERHKWFYFRQGAPSVDHPYILTVNLKGVGIDFLLAMAEEVSDTSQKTSPHALLRKANEPNCVGIHEELLDVFCSKMVNNITSAQAK